MIILLAYTVFLDVKKPHGIRTNIVMVTEREGNNSKTVSNKQEQLPFHQQPSIEGDICFTFVVSRLEEKQDYWKQYSVLGTY